MVQHSSNFTQLTDFDPVLSTIFYQHYGQELGNGGVMALFAKRRSTKAKETDLRVGSFSDPVEFTGKVEYMDAEKDYDVEYVHKQYAKGFMVERTLLDDQQYETIFGRAEEMGAAFARFRRKQAASVFNNATSSSYTGYDGKALCANDHPRSETDSTSVDNLAALPLTSANLETAVVNMQSLGDDLGEEITIMPNVLVVPRELRKTALEIVGSDKVPENANNAINVQSGLWNVVVDPYLSSTTAWWIVDSSMAGRYLKWYDRIMPEFGAEGDFDTFIRKYRGYMRFSFGWSDFRFIYQGNS